MCKHQGPCNNPSSTTQTEQAAPAVIVPVFRLRGNAIEATPVVVLSSTNAQAELDARQLNAQLFAS
jgi:hypothetical protein